MKKATINTISDLEGLKTIITIDGVSKMSNGKLYPFNREIVQVRGVEAYEIEAEGFYHAVDIIRYEQSLKSLRSSCSGLRTELNTLKSSVLRKLGKKLKGKKDQTKLNNFVR